MTSNMLHGYTFQITPPSAVAEKSTPIAVSINPLLPFSHQIFEI